MRYPRFTQYLTGLAVLLALGGSRAYAQFEIDPDHYETREPEPQQSKTNTPARAAKIHYEGNFTLAYPLQCNGRSLPPGKYSVSLDSDERTAQLALNRNGQVMRIQGIPRKQNPVAGRNSSARVLFRRHPRPWLCDLREHEDDGKIHSRKRRAYPCHQLREPTLGRRNAMEKRLSCGASALPS